MDKRTAISSGLTRYMPETPCKQGHMSERWVKSNACIECSQAATKLWRVNNQAKVKQLDAERRKRDPKRGNKYKVAWKQRNKDQVLLQGREYYHRNIKKIKAKAKQKRQIEQNKEKQRIAVNAWRQANPDKASDQVSRRRSARLNAMPSWADKDKILSMYKQAVEQGMTVDHVIPLQNHIVCGLHVPENLQLLSASENSKKGNAFNGLFC